MWISYIYILTVSWGVRVGFGLYSSEARILKLLGLWLEELGLKYVLMVPQVLLQWLPATASLFPNIF